jgi:hypothetical protein
MKTTDLNIQIKQAFADLEKSKFYNAFILSLAKQWKKTKALSQKQQKILFEVWERSKEISSESILYKN